jgi:hypothetical protein
METQSRGHWSKTQRLLPLAVGAAYLVLLRILLSTRAPSSASLSVRAALYTALFFYAVGASILTIATFRHFRAGTRPGRQETYHSLALRYGAPLGVVISIAQASPVVLSGPITAAASAEFAFRIANGVLMVPLLFIWCGWFIERLVRKGMGADGRPER